MNAKTLTDSQLLFNVNAAAGRERRVILELIRYFAEIENRKLFAVQYSSMFEFATKELKMSEGQAQRRIDAARVYREIPEIGEKLTSGQLNLMHLTTAQRYFRHEKKEGRVPTKTAKLNFLKELEGKSTREAEKLVAKRTGQEKLRAIRIKPTPEEREILERVRDLWAHRFPDGDWTEITVAMAELTLKQIDPLEKAKRAAERRAKSATASSGTEPAGDVLETGEVQDRLTTEKRSRYVTAEVAHEAWLRSGARCEHIAPDGTRCSSAHALELEHRVPFALGGENSKDNIRIVCRTHNALLAREVFGTGMMARVVAQSSRTS